ncbi:MAG: hypothetical protein JJE40_19925 [Vicinamibacteria bacterium]|nr:hypothetical protein [Vicinamibacteria bacterium]
MAGWKSAFLVLLALSPAVATGQGKSGPRALDACGLATKVELEEALKKKVQSRPVPPGTPTTLGVSTCMWATANGRQTLSVTTYTQEALKRTQTRTLATYYDALKTSNANNAGRPAIVLPGIARHASYFPAAGTLSTVLIYRHDSIVVINLTGWSKDEATAIAKAAGN